VGVILIPYIFPLDFPQQLYEIDVLIFGAIALDKLLIGNEKRLLTSHQIDRTQC
jgi:hypothetical protein